ncbi:MAG: hypothetical protein IT353_23795 [Gemmatimonadaceae bacterium]|nr:hypothetical protein [Gemmatimonadaceae bacterium]
MIMVTSPRAPRVGALILFALLPLMPSQSAPLSAQTPPPKAAKKSAAKDSTKAPKEAKVKAPKDPAAATVATAKVPKAPGSAFFRDSTLFEVTFTTNLRALKRDKGDKAPWHAATLTYADNGAPDGKRVVPVRARTRGIWRLKNCDFPPVRFNFANKTAKGTAFEDLDEPKLVSYCRGSDTYEQYVLQEFQLYRIYRLLTPVSHQVRLLRMAYADSATGKVDVTKYAFLVEDPAQVAKAAGGKILNQQGAGPEDLEPQAATLAYVFQYFIGNVDFSFGGLHNAELIAKPDGTNLPIAYDFDFAGAINAPYATPDPSLPIKRVRQRLYRGFCLQNALVPGAVAAFVAKKDQIYALYRDQLGALLSPKEVKEALEYFDEFYKATATPKDIERNLLSDCRK